MTEKFETKGKALIVAETVAAVVPDFRRLLMMVAMTAVMSFVSDAIGNAVV